MSASFSIKRIMKDLQEIQDNPVEGVGICMLNKNDPYQMLLNVQILQGRYAGLIVHMILILPQQYPCKPPRILIFPGQQYDHSFHHHIYPNNDGYFKFCIDLLDEAIMDSTSVGSGWSPGYTFCTLMMQIQNFLADPDFHSKSQELSDQQIEVLSSKMDSYTYEHTVNGKTEIHSTKNPFPPIQATSKPPINVVNKSNKQQDYFQMTIRERLSCFMTKENIETNPEGVFGYPILTTKDKFGRLQQKPVPEILSYEGFKSQLEGKYGWKQSYKTGMGEEYNQFIPIFINKSHYARSQAILKVSLSQISSEQQFEKQVIQVLPNLINKMLVALLNGSTHQSVAFFEAYIHFTQLFQQLVRDNPALESKVDRIVLQAIESDKSRSKHELGDFGEFFIILSASKYVLTSDLMNLLYRESFARQIMWIPKNISIQKFQQARNISDKLSAAFDSAKISTKLLIFNIQAANKFSNDREYLDKLATERCSVISEKDALEFVKSTNDKIAEIKSHLDLMKFLGLEKLYPTSEACFTLFQIALCVSNQQGYTRFDQNLIYGKSVTFEQLNLFDAQKNQTLQANMLILKNQNKAIQHQQQQNNERQSDEDNKNPEKKQKDEESSKVIDGQAPQLNQSNVSQPEVPQFIRKPLRLKKLNPNNILDVNENSKKEQLKNN